MKTKPVEEWTRPERDAARAILLEASPYAVDGGGLIGRDPRSIKGEEFQQAGIYGDAILAVIRAKCLDCCVYQVEEVRKCAAVVCPNWPYRMGTNPFYKRELTDEQRAAQAERARASLKRRRATLEPVTLTSANSVDDPAATQAPAVPQEEQI